MGVSRYDRFNPTRKRWYVVANDLVGGYAVSLYDMPLSEQPTADGGGGIADFSSESVARHIADLHNTWAEKAMVDALLDGDPELADA